MIVCVCVQENVQVIVTVIVTVIVIVIVTVIVTVTVTVTSSSGTVSDGVCDALDRTAHGGRSLLALTSMLVVLTCYPVTPLYRQLRPRLRRLMTSRWK